MFNHARIRNKSATSRIEAGAAAIARSAFEKTDGVGASVELKLKEKLAHAKKTVKKKGRLRQGKPDSSLPSTLGSIAEHKKFKQLATYSIDCVTSAVAPINSNWEWNVQEALRQNIAQKVGDVLKIHKNEDHVLMQSCRCIQHICPHQNMSEEIVRNGAFDSMLGTIDNSQTELHDQEKSFALNVLCDITEVTDPSLPYTNIAVDTVVSIMQKHKGVDMVLEPCIRLLEHMARNPMVGARLASGGGIDILLQSLDGAGHEVVQAAFNLLNQLCADGLSDAVKNAGALKTIVKAMMAHLDNESLLQSGSQLIQRLVGKDMDGAIAALQEAGLSEAEIWFVLALDSSQRKELMEHDVITKLINILNGPPDPGCKEMEIVCRTLERLAVSNDVVDEIVAKGGIDALLKVYDHVAKSDEDDDLKDSALTAALRALTKLMRNSDLMRKVVDAGAVEKVLDRLKESPHFEKHVLEALRFLSRLQDLGYDMQNVADMGGIEAVIEGMKRNLNNAELQMHGMNVLDGMVVTDEQISEALRCGLLDHILNIMRTHPEEKELILKCLKMLNKIAGHKVPGGGFEQMQALAEEKLDAFALVMYEHQGEGDIKGKMPHLLEVVSSKEKVEESVANLVEAMNTPNLDDYAGKCQKLLKMVAMWPTHKGNLEHLLPEHGSDVDALDILLKSLEKLSATSGCEDQEQCLSVNLYAINQFLQAKPKLSEPMVDRMVKTVLKTLEKFPELVLDAGLSLMYMSALPETHKHIVGYGGLDLAKSVLRHPLTEREPLIGFCVGSATEAIATYNDVHAEAIARKGVSAQALDFCKKHGGEPGFDDAVLKMVETVESITCRPHLCDMVKKQGAIDTLLDLMEEYRKNHPVHKACARALANLLTKEDTLKYIPLLKQVAMTLGDIEPPDTIYKATARTGNMACCGTEFANWIVEADGADHLVKIIDEGHKLEGSREATKDRLVPAALDALGKINDNARPRGGIDMGDAIDVVLAMLREKGWRVPMSVFDFLQSIADDAAAMANFVSKGGMELLFDILKGCGDPDKLKALFQTLAAMTEDPLSEAVKRLGEAGCADWVANWLHLNAADGDPETVAAALRLLANLAAAGYLPSDLEALLQTISNLLDDCMLHCDPNKFAELMRLIAKMALDEDVAKKLLDSSIVAKCVETMRAFPNGYMDDGDVATAFIDMCSTLLANGGEDAAASLIDQGVADLLREMIAAGVLPDDVLYAAGRLLAALTKGAEGAGLEKATDDLEGLLDLEEWDLDEINTALQQLNNQVLSSSSMDEVMSAKVLSALAKVVSLSAQKISSGKLTASEAAQYADAMATAMQTISRMLANPDFAVPTDQLLECIKIVMNADPVACESAVNQALKCLGLLAEVRPEAMEIIFASGVVPVVAELARNGPTEALRAQAKETLRKLGLALNDGVTPEQLAALLDAMPEKNMMDELLRRLMEQLANGKGLLCATIPLLPHNAVALHALLDALDGAGLFDADGAASDQGLIASLMEAVYASQKSAREGNPPTEAELALAGKCGELLSKLVGLAADGKVNDEAFEAIAAYSGPGGDGIKTLLDAFLHGNGVSTTYGPEVELQMCRCTAEPVRQQLKEQKVAEQLVKRMGEYAELDPEHAQDYVLQSIAMLRALLGNLGIEGMGELGNLESEAIQSLVATIKRNAMNKDILREGKLLLAELGVSDINLDSDLSYITDILSAADPFNLADEGWMNLETADVFDVIPQEYSDMQDCLRGILDAISGNVIAVNREALHKIVTTMEQHIDDNQITALCAQVLAKLATNAENCRNLADFEESICIVKALEKHSEDPNIVASLMDLLELIAKDPKFAKRIGRAGILAILEAMIRYIDNESLVKACISALSSLAIHHPPNIDIMMELGIVWRFKKVMEKYPDGIETLKRACICLSNLMPDNEENMKQITNELGETVLGIIERHGSAHPALFKMATRAVGNMSISTDDVAPLLEAGAVRILVECMQHLTENKECLVIAIDVIGNLAVPEEDELPEDLRDVLVEDGGVQAIAWVMSQNAFDAQLIESSIDALNNMELNWTAYDAMLEHGVIEGLVDVLKYFQDNTELCKQAAELLEMVSKVEESIPRIAKLSALNALFDSAEVLTIAREEEGTAMLVETMRNVAKQEKGRKHMQQVFSEGRLIERLTHCIEDNTHNLEIFEPGLQILTALSLDDSLAEQIGELATHVMIAGVRKHFKDTDFLATSFECWSQLAFHKKNLPRLVLNGGIPLILQAISAYPEKTKVISKCIAVLDNICIASSEYAVIVMESGGQKAIDTVAEVYADDPEIASLCRHAKVSLETMTLAVREKRDRERDRGLLDGTLETMAADKVTDRIIKLRLNLGDDEHQDVAKDFKGYLSKKKEGKALRKRWMELAEGGIKYWDDKDTRLSGAKEKGMIKLDYTTQVQVNDKDPKTILIQAEGENVMTVLADSIVDGKEWLEAIMHNIQVYVRRYENDNGPPPPPPAEDEPPPPPPSDLPPPPAIVAEELAPPPAPAVGGLAGVEGEATGNLSRASGFWDRKGSTVQKANRRASRMSLKGQRASKLGNGRTSMISANPAAGINSLSAVTEQDKYVNAATLAIEEAMALDEAEIRTQADSISAEEELLLRAARTMSQSATEPGNPHASLAMNSDDPMFTNQETGFLNALLDDPTAGLEVERPTEDLVGPNSEKKMFLVGESIQNSQKFSLDEMESAMQSANAAAKAEDLATMGAMSLLDLQVVGEERGLQINGSEDKSALIELLMRHGGLKSPKKKPKKQKRASQIGQNGTWQTEELLVAKADGGVVEVGHDLESKEGNEAGDKKKKKGIWRRMKVRGLLLCPPPVPPLSYHLLSLLPGSSKEGCAKGIEASRKGGTQTTKELTPKPHS
jgi:hypothetical protein